MGSIIVFLVYILLLVLFLTSHVEAVVDAVIGSGSGGGVSDGPHGDITVSGSGTIWTIAPSAVTYTKMQDVGAGARLLGRGSGAAGPVQELTVGPRCSIVGTVLNCPGTFPTSPADTATINVDAGLFTEVRIAALSQATFLAAPTFSVGTGTIGQRLRYAIFTTTSRPLTYASTATGFGATAGRNLPVKTIANMWLVLDFQLDNVGEKWLLASTSAKIPNTVTGTDVSSVTIDCNAAELFTMPASAQASYTINNPVCTPFDGQMLRVRMTSTGAAKPISSWGSQFTATAGVALPTTTSGGGIEDTFGFQHNGTNFVMVATTQNPVANKRRRCSIPFGSEAPGSSILLDAEIIATKSCRVFGAVVVEEIGIEAKGAFQPSVIMQNLTNNTTVTTLTGVLQAATNGGYACMRPSAGTGLAGVSCASGLVNNAIAAGDNVIGVTSGVANTATNLIVHISWIELP